MIRDPMFSVDSFFEFKHGSSQKKSQEWKEPSYFCVFFLGSWSYICYYQDYLYYISFWLGNPNLNLCRGRSDPGRTSLVKLCIMDPWDLPCEKDPFSVSNPHPSWTLCPKRVGNSINMCPPCWWFRNPKQPPGMYKTLSTKNYLKHRVASIFSISKVTFSG